MTTQEKIEQQGWFWWDDISQEIALEKDATKPSWAYIKICNKREDDSIITEHYTRCALDFAYPADMPANEVAKARQMHFQRHNADKDYCWRMERVDIPNNEFENYLKQYL